MRIVAIDGALNHSGWVVLDVDAEKLESIKSVKNGKIVPKTNMSLASKLLYIRQELIKLFRTYEPDMIVFEDTYAGKNPKTTSRLNNAKGVILMTAYEWLNKEPACVKAIEARACLGFKNGKEPKREPWEYFRAKYKLKMGFKAGNDITDAYTLGWWYVKSTGEGCVERKKQSLRLKKVATRDNKRYG